MKTLKDFVFYATAFVIAFFVVSYAKAANAEVLARAKNEAGTYVYFTDVTCKVGDKTYDNLSVVRTKDNKGIPFRGCYGLDEDTDELHVFWFEYDGKPMEVITRIFTREDLEFKQGSDNQPAKSKAKTIEI